MSAYGSPSTDPYDEPTAFGTGLQYNARKMTPAERERVWELGKELTAAAPGTWILISGQFTSGNGEKSTEGWIEALLRKAFGYPDWAPPAEAAGESSKARESSKPAKAGESTENAEAGQSGAPGKPGEKAAPDYTEEINVLVDSPGGNLDSAYTTVLYLSAYTKKLNIYVPGRAKSASTLLAVGADTVHLSPFGELGPLDTQIPDPRNPAKMMSALDCYQSVDYVRDFGSRSISSVLPQLVRSTERRISVGELLTNATTFALGAISPSLQSVTALDFGGWGRSLRIGEHYARKLLQAKMKDGDQARVERISRELVYGYTHHLFPIDYHEADRIGLPVTKMRGDVYDKAIDVVDACHKKDFVTFLSGPEAEKTMELYEDEDKSAALAKGQRANGRHPQPERAKAEVEVTGYRDADLPDAGGR